jgi:hypothetical protein
MAQHPLLPCDGVDVGPFARGWVRTLRNQALLPRDGVDLGGCLACDLSGVNAR